MDGDKAPVMQHEGDNLFRPEEAMPSTTVAAAGQSGNFADETAAPRAGDTITWSASEFIAHRKTSSWYLLLGLSAVVIALLVLLVTRDLFPTGSVFVGVVLLGVYAGRMPHEETYRLDSHGIAIGQRHYLFGEFRSFAVIPEGAFLSIQLTPLKRLAMYTTMYIDPADEDKIIDRLSQYLPMEAANQSLIDNLMHRIHF